MLPNSTLQNTQHFHPLKQLLKTIAGILLSGMMVSQSPAQMPRENVGDVWVLGGQSNIEFRLSRIENGQLEIVSANLPKIRILTFPFQDGPENKESFPRRNHCGDLDSGFQAQANQYTTSELLDSEKN